MGWDHPPSSDAGVGPGGPGGVGPGGLAPCLCSTSAPTQSSSSTGLPLKELASAVGSVTPPGLQSPVVLWSSHEVWRSAVLSSAMTPPPSPPP